MAADVGDLLQRGRHALAAADWERARTCFEQAGEGGETAEVLDGLSEVAHFEGDYARAIELKERAFAAYRRAGEAVGAANAARWLAFLHGTFRGDFAAAGGWIARAGSVLDGVETCAAHGWLTLDHAPLSRDVAEREQLAVSALAIARRFGDADLEFEALALLGETHVAAGRVAEGMKLVDEAMAAVSAGEVRGHGAVGEIYCRLLSACEYALDVRRAEEWMAHIDRHVVWKHFVRPTCRTHYGGILIALGRWGEAEAELLDAIRVFDRGYRGDRVFPLVRLADLRVRQGRYEEGERLLEGAEWHPAARQVAAAIAMGRRELGLAGELARLCLEASDTAKPACAPVLDLLVEVALEHGDLETARQARDQLEALAAASGDERARAFERLATGRLAAAGSEGGAVAHLTQALELFSALQLPLEAARAQLEAGRTLAGEAPAAATHETRLALAQFERLGAARDADAAASLLRELGDVSRGGPRRRGALTKREIEVLALLGDGLSNAEIAQRLYVSRRTAEHHVAHILSKLDLRSRAEAAAYAVRERPERSVSE